VCGWIPAATAVASAIAALLPAAAPATYPWYASAPPWSNHHTDGCHGGLATESTRTPRAGKPHPQTEPQRAPLDHPVTRHKSSLVETGIRLIASPILKPISSGPMNPSIEEQTQRIPALAAGASWPGDSSKPACRAGVRRETVEVPVSVAFLPRRRWAARRMGCVSSRERREKRRYGGPPAARSRNAPHPSGYSQSMETESWRRCTIRRLWRSISSLRGMAS